ncbi:DUF4406 domain-containing protein [Pseudomonas aeruginosa]
MIQRIYLAGPMTGLPEHNFPAFHAEAARLRQFGYHVENPAEINPEGGSWSDCMRRDIPQLLTCDSLALLPGWDKLTVPASSTASPPSWACRCTPPARSPTSRVAQYELLHSEKSEKGVFRRCLALTKISTKA